MPDEGNHVVLKRRGLTLRTGGSAPPTASAVESTANESRTEMSFLAENLISRLSSFRPLRKP